MTAEEVQLIFKDLDARLSGHFVGTSKHHTNGYLEKRRILRNSRAMSLLGRPLAEFTRQRWVDFLVAPEGGGLGVARAIQRNIPEDSYRPPIVTILKMGKTRSEDLDRIAGRRVIVADDVIHTGHTLRWVIQTLTKARTDISAIVAFATYGIVDATMLDVPEIFSLMTVDIKSWAATPEDPCPLCEQHIPVNTEFGHGEEFLKLQSQQEE